MKILVTGTAGFIGFHLARRLLAEGDTVCGVDNFNDYYSVQLKEARNAELEKNEGYSIHRVNLADKDALKAVFDEFQPEVVVNLAAQAGVRYSLTHPEVYMESNLVGFLNVLECCRHAKPQPTLLYASSSSVYGGNKELPFSEDQSVDKPISLYAASKKANELMAHCYSHLYGMQTFGFRFFTVYGPWGRPDMAAWLFAKAMSEGRSIKVFNNGDMYRDFTYVDDIVDGLVRCIRKALALPRYDVFNIGNHRSEKLMDMIGIIAREMGVENPKMELLPLQDGDVPATYASVEKLNKAVGYEPTTTIEEGMPRFCKWYKEWRENHPED
jgi:UDP-glucuronate 4-epimerase